MPAPTLISWEGLTIEVAPDGVLTTVALAGQAEPLLTDVAVVLGDGWTTTATEILLDEIEQRFEFATDGTVLARAVVRQVFDAAWSLRLQITNLNDEQLVVPAARLAMESVWPTRRWLAGAEGSISVDAGRADGALLTFTQLRGRSRLSGGMLWLTDLPITLGAAGTTAGTYQVGWRADWLRDERMQAAALPGWWPERHVLADGDIVELTLPDAAVEAAGIGILEHEETSVLTARPGHHIAQVHAGRGTTDVELFWASSLVDGYLVPAAQALLGRDVRELEPHEVFLLGRAQAARGLGDEAAAHVTDAVAVIAAKAGARPTTPLGLAAVADEVIRTGAPDLVEALPALAAHLPWQPGAFTSLLHANLASRLAGGVPTLPLPTGERPTEAVASAIIGAELLVLDPPAAMPASAVRVAALLGAGMPGVIVDEVTRAQVWAVTGLFPEGWEPGQRWPVTLGMARDLARDELLARTCGDEALAWLAW